MARYERNFQSKLIDEIYARFGEDECIVLKTNPNYIQGFPDLLILFRDHWAALECKRIEDASRQPNQPYWVGFLDRMSFAAFIYPENKEEVLNDLQQALQSGG